MPGPEKLLKPALWESAGRVIDGLPPAPRPGALAEARRFAMSATSIANTPGRPGWSWNHVIASHGLRAISAPGSIRLELSNAVRVMKHELERIGLMFSEWGSYTYSALNLLSYVVITLAALLFGGDEEKSVVRRWWRAFFAMVAPWYWPATGQVVQPGRRCKRETDRPTSWLLQLVRGERLRGFRDAHRSKPEGMAIDLILRSPRLREFLIRCYEDRELSPKQDRRLQRPVYMADLWGRVGRVGWVPGELASYDQGYPVVVASIDAILSPSGKPVRVLRIGPTTGDRTKLGAKEAYIGGHKTTVTEWSGHHGRLTFTVDFDGVIKLGPKKPERLPDPERESLTLDIRPETVRPVFGVAVFPARAIAGHDENDEPIDQPADELPRRTAAEGLAVVLDTLGTMVDPTVDSVVVAMVGVERSDGADYLVTILYRIENDVRSRTWPVSRHFLQRGTSNELAREAREHLEARRADQELHDEG